VAQACAVIAASSPDMLRSRRLDYEWLARYHPESIVTDHAAIDLDQLAIESQLARKTDEGFQNAKAIYQQGGYSKSFAQLKLNDPLPFPIKKGTIVTGIDSSGASVAGTIMIDAEKGISTLSIQYKASESQADYVTCQVGALSSFGMEKLDGCFAVNGTIDINDEVVEYTYDPKANNNNARTISDFSKSAGTKMFNCGAGCPHQEFLKYYNYYGTLTYGDDMVLGALDGEKTLFKNGNLDFSKYNLNERAAFAKRATKYMNIYMYVIREMEDSIGDCKASCKYCNDDPVHAWDEAVAFYTGSLQQGKVAGGEGVLLYSLADRMCLSFNTCGPKGKSTMGTSKVNTDIFELFALGQYNLQSGQCELMRDITDRIIDLMAIPLIQSVLYYSYQVDQNRLIRGEEEMAAGAAVAHALLPRIAACNMVDAWKVYDNLSVNAKNPDFHSVKKALENNYECMNTKCSDVGGVWSAGMKDFQEGAEPCSISSQTMRTANSSNTVNILAIALGSAAGAIALLSCCCILFLYRREKDGNPVFKQTDKTLT